MKNCYVTQLPISCDNGMFPILNSIVIDLEPGVMNLMVKPKSECKVFFNNSEDTIYADGTAISSGYTITKTDSSTVLSGTITKKTKLQIGDMYDMLIINQGASHTAEISFENLAYVLKHGSLTFLNVEGKSDEKVAVSDIINPLGYTRFACNTGMFTGSLSGFGAFTAATWIKVKGSEGLTGEITSFIPCKAVVQLDLSGCDNINEGTYESLVAGQCNAQSGIPARTSGTLYVYSDKHTFRDIQRDDVKVVFSATGATVQTGAGVTLGTYTTSNNAWTYA